MSNAVILDKLSDDKKFGFLINSKFFGAPKTQSCPAENLRETVYRRNSNVIDKIIEYHPETGRKVKVTNFDYFNDKKIKSIEEFDSKTGAITKITRYGLFKSVTEYDIKTGNKIKITNYDIKNETHKTSVYDFDAIHEKISRVSIFRSDGNTVSMTKEFNPSTGLVTRVINYQKNSNAISSVSNYDFQGCKTIKTTFYYNTPVNVTSPAVFDKKNMADLLNKKVQEDDSQKRINRLIDNLYKNKLSFSMISVK